MKLIIRGGFWKRFAFDFSDCGIQRYSSAYCVISSHFRPGVGRFCTVQNMPFRLKGIFLDGFVSQNKRVLYTGGAVKKYKPNSGFYVSPYGQGKVILNDEWRPSELGKAIVITGHWESGYAIGTVQIYNPLTEETLTQEFRYGLPVMEPKSDKPEAY